jgi:hypothetical protein
LSQPIPANTSNLCGRGYGPAFTSGLEVASC